MSVHDFGDADEDFNRWFDTIDDEDLLDSDTAVLATEVAGHLQPLTREEILFAQQDDDDVKKLKTKWSLDPKQPYLKNEHGLFCRRAPSDGAIQIVLPVSLRERVLLLAHYPRIAGHPGGSRMYQTLRQTFYWPSMSMDVYDTVRQCTSCAKERIALRKHASYLSLFPAKAPLEYVAIDILGPLPYTTGKRNRYLLVIADRYSKLTKTVPLKNITAATVARAFVEHWVFHFGPPAKLLSDNGGQFTSKFFQQVCQILGIKKLFTTAYHPQTNGQVERFNRTLLSGLRHFCSEHGRDWDQFSDAITYAYNTTVHRATNMSPMQFVFTRPLPSLVLTNAETIDDSAFGPRQQAELFAERLKKLMATASTQLRSAQLRYKRDFDKHVRTFNTDLKVGELVFVRRETAREKEEMGRQLRGDVTEHHKLRSKALGPYPVVAVAATHITILRNGLSDTISKDRVIRAPVPQRNYRGNPVFGQELSTEDLGAATVPKQPPALPGLESSNDAIVYPPGAGPTNEGLPDPMSLGDVIAQRPRGRGREEIQPGIVLDDEGPLHQEVQTSTASELEPSEVSYAVDRIIAHDFSEEGAPRYSVKWTGYAEPTWEPRDYIPYKPRLCLSQTH